MILTVLILALAAEAGFQLYLNRRQARWIGRHRGSVPADFAAVVTLAAHQRAADYSLARLRLAALREGVDLALNLAFLLGGFALVYAAVVQVMVPGPGRSVAFLLACGVVGEVVSLPFQAYATFGIEQRFGFNRTTLARFAGDVLRGGVLALFIMAPMLFGAFWLMRHGTGLWWLYAWAGFMVISLGLAQAYPRLIAPLFNRFTPLAGTLRPRLENLLARCGFRADGLFVMDASKRSAKGNAYFTGLGRSKRIVLFDTLVERHTPEEIEAVLAHELGHFRHHHILIGTLRMAVLSFGAFLCFGLIGRQHWLTDSLGLGYRDDALSVAVFLMWAGALGPFLRLAGNWFSRRAEFQADAYARDVVGAEPLVSALTRLTNDSAGTLTPDPLYALFQYSHPPVPLRVAHLRAG